MDGKVRVRGTNPGPKFMSVPGGVDISRRSGRNDHILGFFKGPWATGTLQYFGTEFPSPFDDSTTSADVDSWAKSNEDFLNAALLKYEQELVFNEAFSDEFSLLEQKSESMEDIVIDKFKSRSAAGEIFNNPMTKTSNEITVSPPSGGGILSFEFTEVVITGMVTSTRASIWNNTKITASATGTAFEPSQLSTFNSGFPALGHMDGTAAQADSIANLSNTSFDSLVFLAEFGKTAQHLALTASRIFKIYKAIKKGKFSAISPNTFRKWRSGNGASNAYLTADIISDAWLEARYAWRPLMIDAQKALKLLAGGSSITPRKTFRGGDSEENDDTHNFSFSSAKFSYVVESSSISVHSARAGILAQVNYSRAADLGFFDVLNVAWELVPFSFVVDWFLNVSGFLQGIAPNPSVEPLTSWLTLRSERNITGSVLITSLASGHSNTLYFKARDLIQDRLVDPDPPGFINLDINFDTKKLIDSVALLWRLST